MHLYELGHRRIAFMRGPRAIPDSEFRWESIQQVAREMDLKIDPALVIRIDAAGWSMKTGHHPMAPGDRLQADAGAAREDARLHRHLLLQRHRGHRRHSRAEGCRPARAGDVSVVGFDDILSAAYSTPSLTTVRQPLTEMGKRGAQILLERIANREKEFPVGDRDGPGAGGARVDGPVPQTPI